MEPSDVEPLTKETLGEMRDALERATKPWPAYAHAQEGDNPRCIFYEWDRKGVDMATFRGPNRITNAELYRLLTVHAKALLALAERAEAYKELAEASKPWTEDHKLNVYRYDEARTRWEKAVARVAALEAMV